MSEEEQIILPDGFERVEYLESIGKQWIQTDYCPCNETKIVSTCYFIKAGTNGRFCGNGSVYGGNTDTFTIFLSAYGTNAIIFDFGNVRTDKNNFNLSVGKHVISADKNGLVIDGSVAIATNHTVEFQSTNPISLFAAGGESTQDGDYWRIYDFIIYERGEIICHFIPCLNDDNEPCMYDVINKKSYTNAGTGKFLTTKDLEWNYPDINNSYNLPAGFKKCVYLQSDGTQWIDTRVLPNNETGLFCKTIKLDNSNTSMFGVRENDSSAIMTPFVSGKTTLYYKWKAEGKDTTYTLDKDGDYIFSSFLNFYNDRLAKIDSEDTDWITNLSGILENYTQSIWLFSTNFKGSFASNGKYAGRIYRAQITQGDALIHDYVPCLDADNRPCMYDLIESEALYNQSGGTEFAYCVEHQLPSDFVKLKYLEGTGTQYIETGYVPTNTTGLYVDAQQITHTNTQVMGSGNESNSTGFGAPRFLKGTANSCGFLWKTWNSYGSIGNGTRFEGYLNFFNNRKANLKTAGTTERISNLGELGFTPTASLHMFRANYSSQGCWVGRIYRAKISEGSEIVRDFVPALDERKSKPCMYDLINNAVYYNDGEGEFLTNRDFEGTYKGYTGLGCIGNRLGTSEFEWKIPYGYRRVAYLESNGFNKCVINYKPNDNTGYYTHYKCISNAKYQHVLSVSSPSVGAILFTPHYNGDAYNFFAAQRNENGEATRWDIKDINLYEKVKTEYNFFNSKKCYVNGKYLFDTLNTITKPDDIQINLFMYPTSVRQNEGLVGRLYEAKITENDKLLYHFIPCLDPNNKPCMFDIITQQPFYNQGNSEDFTYGTF